MFCWTLTTNQSIFHLLFWPLLSVVTARGRVPQQHFSSGNFCWPTGKREGRKKGKMEKKRRKIERGKAEKRKVTKWRMRRDFFKIFFFCFSLFKTTEICFGFTKMGIFYRGKAFHAGKNFRKNYFAPSEKYSSYTRAPPGGKVNSSRLLLYPDILKSVGWATIHQRPNSSWTNDTKLPVMLPIFSSIPSTNHSSPISRTAFFSHDIIHDWDY